MINENIKAYLEGQVTSKQDWVMEMEAYAQEHHVPIMDRISIDYMLQLIRVHQPLRILEVGTAIGYSALRMHEASPEAQIITIEKDEARKNIALENIKKQNKATSISVIQGDANDVLVDLQNNEQSFDFIFIDAAKGQYESFFNKCESMLVEGGIILTDNVLFRGFVADVDTTPKRFKNMVKKISVYNERILSHPSYISSLLPIGDGVMVSFKKKAE